jgi:hypothetical protein
MPRAHCASPAASGAAFVTDGVEGARATLRRYAERQQLDHIRDSASESTEPAP